MSLPYSRLSVFYFSYFAIIGGLVPYWSLYLKDVGFNASEIGLLSALLVGTKIIAPNIWGWIADHTGKSLIIMRLAIVIALVFFLGFFFAQSYTQFAWVTFLFSFFWNATLPQLDVITLAHLRGKTEKYSHIRLWGSVGFIVNVQLLGYLLDIRSPNELPLFLSGFFIVLSLISLVTPEPARIIHDHQPIAVKKILSRRDVLAFFSASLLLQIAHAPYYVFYSIYLKSLGYSATVTGLLWALGVIAEIILFIFMARVLAKYSLRSILLFGIGSGIIRWLMVAHLSAEWHWSVLSQLLHASSFGAVHIVSVLLIQHYFGTQHAGKGQALYNSVSFGIGGMFGSALSGYYWEQIGATITYSMSALCCALALLIAYYWISPIANTKPQTAIIKKASKKPPRKNRRRPY